MIDDGDNPRRCSSSLQSDGEVLRYSVIVPFLDEERWLPHCLEGLRRQTIAPELVEWLFVDNGSSDGSAAIVRAESRARLLHQEVRDPYLARNTGIREARGRYLVFLDADCIADPGWLAAIDQHLGEGDVAIANGFIGHPRPASLLLRLVEDYDDAQLRYLAEEGPRECLWGHAGNMAIRSDVFAAVGLFRPMPVVGDVEIIHRYLAHVPTARIAYIPEAKVVHAEVATFRDYLLKMYEYGKHAEHLREVDLLQPLPLPARARVIRRCGDLHGYGSVSRLVLKIALAMAWTVYGRGAAAASRGCAVRSRRPP